MIAVITDHCCQLVIKCKKAAVQLTLDKLHKPVEVELDEEDLLELQNRIERKTMYGDIGRIALGKWGTLLVNAALLATQFGFCIGYFIFLGNTVSSMFPVVRTKPHHMHRNASIPHHNQTSNTTNVLGNKSDGTSTTATTAPVFPLLLLIPAVPLVLMAFIRNVRKLGPISFLANLALLVAFVSVIGYMLSGMCCVFS